MFHCKQRFIKQVIVHTNCMNSVFNFHSNVQIEFFFIKVQTKVSKHTSKYNVSSDVRCCIPNNGGICSSRYYLPCGKWREIARVLRTFFKQSPVPLTETFSRALSEQVSPLAPVGVCFTVGPEYRINCMGWEPALMRLNHTCMEL